MMPLAKVYIPEGVLNIQQRSDIVKGISDVINSVENRPVESHKYTYVLINEIQSGGWGVGGQIFSNKK